jgi:AcrR family transcriptional regulator
MDARTNDHRRRLLEAMAATVASKGYAAVTIADLAAEARVSKRSFYEQFRDKADCFITLYDEVSQGAVQVLHDAFDPGREWYGQIDGVLGAYLDKLMARPGVLYTLFVDVMALGPDGLAARRRTTERFADFIVRASGEQLTRDQATGIVGGLHEWVLLALEQQRIDDIRSFAARGAHFIRAVIAQGPQPLDEAAPAHADPAPAAMPGDGASGRASGGAATPADTAAASSSAPASASGTGGDRTTTA